MKNVFIIPLKKLAVNMLFMTAVSLVFFSCSKEEMHEAELNATLQTEAEAKANKAAPAPGDKSIAAIALANEDFSELVEALVYVDAELGTQLVDMFMNGTDQYTVFAPTNDAFYGLYSAVGITDNDISALPAPLVRDVLLYHVVEGRRAANSVVPPKNPRQIETLLGAYFWVDSSKNIQAVGNTATIVMPNISASNGIIHVIDAVILPIEL